MKAANIANGNEPAVPAGSRPGWVKSPDRGAMRPTSSAPMGPSVGSVHYQRVATQPRLSAAELEVLRREPTTSAKGRLPIGVGRPLEQAIMVSRDTAPLAEWTVLPNGWRIWSVGVTSLDALGLRVHLEAVTLPVGVRVVVYDPAHPARATTPIAAENVSAEREAWAKTIFADKVVVECQVPPGVEPAGVTFAVTGVSHIYRLPQARVRALDDAGPCHNDVTCFPAWARQAAGVAEITFVDKGTSYLCTGCLLSNGNTNSATDYFLTANHCVTSQGIASTLELFWFYQTSTCNGAPPSEDTVPHTAGGADLLAGSSVNDFTFLRLREAPPAGVYYLGWSRTLLTASDSLGCIQHPSGSYKRISFGNELSFDPSFWWVQWSSGASEPGSSGAPLMNGNHQVVGQLWGGDSSCDHPSGLDGFGRFDVTYNAIQQWIDPVSILKGTYTGLFRQTNGIAQRVAGSFSLTTTATGKFTGQLKTGATRASFHSQFDGSGSAQVSVTAGSLGSVMVTLHLDLVHGTDRITGTVSGQGWVAELAGDRAVFDGRTAIAPQAGKYTLVLPGNYNSASEPGGDSYGTVSVSGAGKVLLTGLLADGTKVSQSAAVSKYGQWPVYIPLYGNQGSIISWLAFSNTSAGDLGGDVAWVKPLSSAKYYPAGFAYETTATGSLYNAPQAGLPALSLANAALVLSGGSPQENITKQLALTQNQVSIPSDKLRLTFTPSTGLFRGSVTDPLGQKPLQFTGVVLQKQALGAGYFLGAAQSGRVLLEQAQ